MFCAALSFVWLSIKTAVLAAGFGGSGLRSKRAHFLTATIIWSAILTSQRLASILIGTLFIMAARQGRNPNEFFDLSWYLERNPDVREAGIDPLKHYIERGWKEGRDPGPKFSVKNYLDRYRDVRDAGLEPLEHYIRYGKLEGRLIGESRLIGKSYGDWIAKYDTLGDNMRMLMAKRVAQFALQPKLSIVMPVYNTDLRWLREAIQSVRAQLYPHWELCISDDASTLPGVKELLREYADKDERIHVVFRDTNGHISANSNSALSVATGDFIALMDADDLLPEDALYWVVEEINAHPNVDLIFSDEDKIDIEGRRYDPYFKPDWNPALMLSQNMFCHLGVYRHSLVKKVGSFRLGFEGSQDHDLVLRCADATQSSKIRHIPHILYHWRALPEIDGIAFRGQTLCVERRRPSDRRPSGAEWHQGPSDACAEYLLSSPL